MNAQEHKLELERIMAKMPWREIAEAYIFGKEIEVNSWLDRVITEYKLLKTEIEGMKENPDAWAEDEDHTQTHINALKKLLGARDEA